MMMPVLPAVVAPLERLTDSPLSVQSSMLKAKLGALIEIIVNEIVAQKVWESNVVFMLVV